MIVDFIESRNRSDSSWNTRETDIQSIDNPRKTRSSKFKQSLSDSTDLIPYTYILIWYVVQFLIKLDLGQILTLRKQTNLRSLSEAISIAQKITWNGILSPVM